MDTWEPYPDVGLAELDVEHRALGRVVQALARSVIDDDRERAAEALRELREKGLAHFLHEKAIMEEIGYPHAERHAGTHREFLNDAAARLDGLVAEGFSAELLRWVGQLDQWFRRHVMTEDLWLVMAVAEARRKSG